MSLAREVGCVGGGVIGAGWIARLLENGIDVAVHDPAPEAERKLRAVLDLADRAYSKLTARRPPLRGSLRFASTISEAVAGADWIVESVPERLALKQEVYGLIEAAAPRNAVIASSTSGIPPSQLQAQMSGPDRLLVAHPFVPVYLLPVVEIVGGARTAPDAINRAMNFYRSLGMKPVHIRKEIDAFVADRLLEAMWRESLWLIQDGICTTQELDDIVRFGFGLRYAQLGVFDTYRVAGGEAGLRHFLQQFGPCLQWPWTRLTEVPDFTEDLVDLIVAQSDAQSGHLNLRELERQRDDNLIAILQALKANRWGAGQILADYEQRILDTAAAAQPPIDYSRPLATLALRVPAAWCDSRGNMTEAGHGTCFAQATETFLALIGCRPADPSSSSLYVASENRLRFLEPVAVETAIRVTTQVIDGNGTKPRLFHSLEPNDGRPHATADCRLAHVALATRKPGKPEPLIAAKLAEIAGFHAKLPRPAAAPGSRSLG